MSKIDLIRERRKALPEQGLLLPPATSILGRGIVANPSGNVIALNVDNRYADFFTHAPMDIQVLLDYIDELEAKTKHE